MGIAKPIGGHAEQMLDPGGWPEVDEDVFYDRAVDFTRVLLRTADIVDTCKKHQAEVFEGGVWSGGAAFAANTEFSTNINHMLNLQHDIAGVVTWHKHVAGSVVQVKLTVGDNVEAAERQISALQDDSSLSSDERKSAIAKVVAATHAANAGVVASAADQILASKGWQPSDNAVDDILDQKAPPTPEEKDEDQSEPAPPQPVVPAPAPAYHPTQPSTGGGTHGGGGQQSGLGAPPTAEPASQTDDGTTEDAPAAVGAVAPAPAMMPLTGGGVRGRGVAPASAGTQTRPDEATAQVAPAAATAVPPAAVPPAAAAGAGAGTGGAPAGNRPSGPTRNPAAAAGRQAQTGPAPRSESMDRPHVADAPGVVSVPISAARAERNVVAEAATAEAVRRERGADPLVLARNIAAALNAPDSGGADDFGFFWLTAVTTGGAIVLANSYGLAYIPEGVELPPQVQLASADERISATERARWATQPVFALQGWARHHGTELRAVIGTKAQFADTDPGVATVLLEPDDIPESGQMTGRSRLEVVNPEAAAQIAAAGDLRSIGLLPPAKADASPPADNRLKLWFDVMKPLTSSSVGREGAHLRAFHTYVTHAQEVALNAAHVAADPAAQRAAVVDWWYWHYLQGLLDAALASAH